MEISKLLAVLTIYLSSVFLFPFAEGSTELHFTDPCKEIISQIKTRYIPGSNGSREVLIQLLFITV
jgi:hypothetical protein